jgi:hypothetical protein
LDRHLVKPLGRAVVEELVKSAAAKKEQAQPTRNASAAPGARRGLIARAGL